MAEIRLEGVSKHFGATRAVSDLSLEVHDAEFVVLLGPTGAGKTTTLRLVAGLERPDRGSIRIAGHDVTVAPIADRDVAFVFQQYSLYPHYTVFDNLAFPLRAPHRRTDTAAIEARVTAVAAMLRIEDKLANQATMLSGGEMQRVAIGRALVREPTVFLMDEPLSSLDAKLREELRIELKRIQTDLGATVFYVTHDQVEAMTLADRIGVLAQGRLVQVGTPHEIYTRPASVYVAQRLGAPAINLVPLGLLDEAGANPAPHGASRAAVRPEDLVLGESGRPGRIAQVERLVDETVVIVDIDGQRLRALIDAGRELAPEMQIRVAARPGALLFFGDDDHRMEN